MPVTARLSKRFYETLGDEVTNELVDLLNAADAQYRSELRIINDLNFARFDAKLAERASQLDARIDKLASDVDAKLDKLSSNVDTKINKLSSDVDAKLDKLSSDIDVKLSKLRAELIVWMFVFIATGTVAVIGLQ